MSAICFGQFRHALGATLWFGDHGREIDAILAERRFRRRRLDLHLGERLAGDVFVRGKRFGESCGVAFRFDGEGVELLLIALGGGDLLQGDVERLDRLLIEGDRLGLLVFAEAGGVERLEALLEVFLGFGIEREELIFGGFLFFVAGVGRSVDRRGNGGSRRLCGSAVRRLRLPAAPKLPAGVAEARRCRRSAAAAR